MAIKPPQITFSNTMSRQKEPFSPLEEGKVRLYTCGPTVYDFAHIGNFRTYVFEDVLKRTLQYFGLNVHHVMNLTDVDDKTIRNAVKQKKSLKAYTEPYIAAFFEDLDALHIARADAYPAATDYIPAMITMIEQLMEKGMAYKAGDGSVYYAIETFPTYGALAHLKRENLIQGASGRVASDDEYEKEHIGDFVLWKGYNPERDGEVYWESPFGPGRPGWHLECSAMAMELLGTTIDIHCGGVDNIFPHHENEIAQSEACSGKTFSRYWLHSEHLVVNGKKMSKSLGNFYRLRDLFEKGYTGPQVRYLLLQTHYKMPLNFTFQGLEAAKEAIHRLHTCHQRLSEYQGHPGEGSFSSAIVAAEERFAHHLADDLNTSAALAAVFDHVREINAAIDDQTLSAKEREEALAFFDRIDQVLAIMAPEEEEEIPQEMVSLLDQRNAARKAKNWAEADALRDTLKASGYLIEDTPTGSHLRKV